MSIHLKYVDIHIQERTDLRDFCNVLPRINLFDVQLTILHKIKGHMGSEFTFVQLII